MADTATTLVRGTAAEANSPEAQRHEKATDVVHRYTAWATAAGVVPVPVVDVLAVGSLQLQMLRRLAQVYEVPFSENRGKSLIASLVGAIAPAAAAPVTAMGIASALKFIPVVGFAVASLSMPAFAGAATYAVGKVFVRHFASGGTLLDFNPRDYREFMKAQAEKAKTRDPSTGPHETSAS